MISADCSQKFNGIHLLFAYYNSMLSTYKYIYFQCAFKLKLKMWYLLFLNLLNNTAMMARMMTAMIDSARGAIIITAEYNLSCRIPAVPQH